jgi:hypothetical protein
MAVHIPLSLEAQAEYLHGNVSSYIISYHHQMVDDIMPSQDGLGCYYLR